MESIPPIIVFGKKISPGLLFGTILGLSVGWICGVYFSSANHALEETKLCDLALNDRTKTLHPQTREYLKARLYSNAAFWVSPTWMQGMISDMGPVDDVALGGIIAIKGPESTRDVYERAMAKHGIPISPR